MVRFVRLISEGRASHKAVEIIGGITILAARQKLRNLKIPRRWIRGLLQRLPRHLPVVFKRLKYRFRITVPANASVICTFQIVIDSVTEFI